MGTLAALPLRRTALPPAAALPDQVQDLVLALGFAHFPKVLVRVLRDLVAAEHLSIITFDRHRLPHVVTAESVGRTPLAKMAGEVYEASAFRRHDPSAELVDHLHPASAEPLFLRVKAEDIGNCEYRSQIYGRFNLSERLSIVAHMGGHWHAVNLYRTQAAGGFSDAQVDTARGLAGLITALVAKHFTFRPPTSGGQLRPTASEYEHLVDQLDCGLTARQIQVCARALTGMTNRAIALDLGITVPTVATLRKRAYAGMNISSLSELFSRCLALAVAASATRNS
jgi:DNA-binding CsgD family transcriptional regulator